MNINFSAFDNSFTYSQRVHESLSRLKLFYKRIGSLAKIIIISSFTLMAIAAVSLTLIAVNKFLENTQFSTLGYMLFFVGLLALFAALVLYALGSFGKRSLLYKNFARDNNFSFSPSFNIKNANSILFNIGYMQIARNAVTGTIDNKNFALFEYRYTKGSGRFQAPVIFTVLALNLGIDFPHTVFENKNGHLQRLKYKKPARLDTETSLDDEFTIYSSAQNINHVSPVVTTEFLLHLLNASRTADIELHGKDVFIFMKGQIESGDAVKSLFAAVQSTSNQS